MNRCTPGGQEVIVRVAALLNRPVVPLHPDHLPAHPPHIVSIREEECIGCTKCIRACPVDAIAGAAKLMHTVIASDCTGCDLCIPVCPATCIDRVPLSAGQADALLHRERSERNRRLFENRQQRMQRQNGKIRNKAGPRTASAGTPAPEGSAKPVNHHTLLLRTLAGRQRELRQAISVSRDEATRERLTDELARTAREAEEIRSRCDRQTGDTVNTHITGRQARDRKITRNRQVHLAILTGRIRRLQKQLETPDDHTADRAEEIKQKIEHLQQEINVL